MKALIFDIDREHRESMTMLLQDEGFSVIATGKHDDVTRLDDDLALALIDIDTGFELLEAPALARAHEVIMMGCEDDHLRVNQGITRGATYFFCKPFDERFLRDLAADLRQEVESTSQAPMGHQACVEQFGRLRGDAESMRRVYRTIRKVAPLDTTVFLTGESGTGKDLAAQSIHLLSSRSDADFVAVNCASIPRDLFESELFGHEKGSFSGAASQHSGFFERAGGGTLFLDEITEIPTELQAKLLRALENQSFRRVGGETDIHSDVRIITSSNIDPEQAIEQGKMRHDLFFRIARFQISLPPLRERGDDIVGLAMYFLDELNQQYGETRTLTQGAIDLLASYTWPGNVRELKSAIERAYIMSSGEIAAKDFENLNAADSIPIDGVEISRRSTIAEAEKKLILAVLDDCDGNRSKAAESLGISLKTLYNRLQAYNVDSSKVPQD